MAQFLRLRRLLLICTRLMTGKQTHWQYPRSRNLLGAYFDNGLLALFLKDQTESQGEVGKLDFDPLYDAQDFAIKGLAIAKIQESKGSAQVAATFKNMGTSKKLLFSLSNGAQGWRISDINYGDGRTLKGILK